MHYPLIDIILFIKCIKARTQRTFQKEEKESKRRRKF